MTAQIPLTITASQISNGTAVYGSRSQMLKAFATRKNILWVRGDGSAVLYYREGGKVRQRTWKQTVYDHTR